MFIRLELNNEKSLHTLPLQSFHLLSLLKIECPLSVAASLILTAILMMCRENPAKFLVWEKIHKSIQLLIYCSSTEQLQVAL
jgi:hypothetical protein